MRIIITKEQAGDRLEAIRADGTAAVTHFPRKGPAPHDAVHFFVEQTFGLSQAFWGRVAEGHHPEAIQDIAKAGGHPSAKRAEIPDPALVELLQAERLVECFEASLWDGALDLAAFRSVAIAACESSHVPAPNLPDDAVRAVDARVRAVADRWRVAAPGERLELEWTA